MSRSARWAIRPQWNGRSKLPPLLVQPSNDRASVITYLCSLPVTWIALIRRSTQEIPGIPDARFDLVVKIGLADGFHPRIQGHIFRLYLDSSARHILLYFKPREWPSGRGGLEVHEHQTALLLGLPEPVPDIENGSILYPSHPYILLGKRLHSIWSKGVADPSARLLFPWNVARSMEARRQRQAAIASFLEALTRIQLGSVRVYASEAQGYCLKKINDDISLFGLTAVFPWAIYMLTAIRPNCAMLDATFRMLKPYILEILHLIYANESIPIAIAVFPTETAESYDLLYTHVQEILLHANIDEKALLELPVVSDQGAGLRSFIRHRKLSWKHCHRHLSEAAGANSQCGDWVARLLRCPTESEYERVRDCIIEEIAILQQIADGGSDRANKILTSPKFRYVKMMLYPHEADVDHQIDLWAKWLRPGCPSTSNATESIHSKLNAIADGGRTFLMRLAILKAFLYRRFTLRNHPERIRRRSSSRFLRRLQGDERILRDLKPDHFDFLFGVNTLVGEDGPIADWVFPEFPSDGWPALPCDIHMVDSLPPDSWRVEAIIQHNGQPLQAILPGIDAPDSEAAIALTNEGPGENAIDDSPAIIDEFVAGADEAPDGGKDVRADDDLKKRVLSVEHPDPEFTRIGWQILSTIRRLATQAEWESSWATAIEQVFKIGGEIWYEHELVNQEGAAEDGEEAAQNLLRKKITAEAVWRMKVLCDLQFYK